MKVAIVLFPGTNCEQDTKYAFELLGCQTQIIWHKESEINAILFKFFADRNLKLVDFKVEFGIDKDGNILLADEISPDSCRFWDATTNEKLDKDRFRQDLGSVKVAYEEVLKRILSKV